MNLKACSKDEHKKSIIELQNYSNRREVDDVRCFLKLNRNDRETKLFSKTVDRVERYEIREGGSTTRGWNFHLEASYLVYPGGGCERRINKRVNEGSVTTVNERLDRASIEFRFCYNASRSG